MAGCQNEVPTAQDPSAIPLAPETIEVLIPASDFISEVRLSGGFGSTTGFFDLQGTAGFVAHQFSPDSLEARTLVRFFPAPTTATVRDTTGASVTDTDLTPIRGFLVGTVDTLASFAGDSVELSVGLVDQLWDAETVSWEFAVDTVQTQVEWTEPGAGPSPRIGAGTWVRGEQADTFRIPLDTTAIRIVSDTTTRVRGLRIDSETPDTRLRIRGLSIQIEAQPSVNPDTSVILIAGADDFSGFAFIYDPVPPPAATELRVGGAPAWRTAISMDIPAQLNGPAALCAIVTCPLVLVADELSSAQLVLTTVESPFAFQPRDSISIGARELLSPTTFPRSPLGESLTPTGGIRITGPAFSTAPGQSVTIPVTSFVQRLIEGPEEGETLVDSFALLSPAEPSSLEFMSFAGLGGADAPLLRLVLTVGAQVGIR